MIDLKQLIQIAPYDEQTRQELLSKADSLSDQQRNDLENLSWEIIREDFENNVTFETQKALAEIKDGTKNPKEVDLEKIEDDIFNQLVSKIQAVDNQAEIAEVRQKIQEQTAKSS